MSSVSLKLDVSFLKRLNEVPDMPVIVLLANDGKITANRMSLRLASPTIHAQLLENPDLAVLDMKNNKKATIATIDSLLYLINNGKTKFNDEVEEQEVISLAKDLGIKLIQSPSIGKNVKIEAPIVPEKEPKNEDTDPGLMELKDGSFSCGLCFKPFPRRSRSAERHYQNVHKAFFKPYSCDDPGCDKKFGNENDLKDHKRHQLQRRGFSDQNPIGLSDLRKLAEMSRKNQSKTKPKIPTIYNIPM